jgi:hypothetical protein
VTVDVSLCVCVLGQSMSTFVCPFSHSCDAVIVLVNLCVCARADAVMVQVRLCVGADAAIVLVSFCVWVCRYCDTVDMIRMCATCK